MAAIFYKNLVFLRFLSCTAKTWQNYLHLNTRLYFRWLEAAGSYYYDICEDFVNNHSLDFLF